MTSETPSPIETHWEKTTKILTAQEKLAYHQKQRTGRAQIFLNSVYSVLERATTVLPDDLAMDIHNYVYAYDPTSQVAARLTIAYRLAVPNKTQGQLLLENAISELGLHTETPSIQAFLRVLTDSWTGIANATDIANPTYPRIDDEQQRLIASKEALEEHKLYDLPIDDDRIPHILSYILQPDTELQAEMLSRLVSES